MPRKTSPRSSQKSDLSAQPEEHSNNESNALPENWNYEQTLNQIEAITHQLETGELPLADVFAQFSEAVNALQQCDRFLQEKQAQASLLIETLVGDEESEET